METNFTISSCLLFQNKWTFLYKNNKQYWKIAWFLLPKKKSSSFQLKIFKKFSTSLPITLVMILISVFTLGKTTNTTFTRDVLKTSTTCLHTWVGSGRRSSPSDTYSLHFLDTTYSFHNSSGTYTTSMISMMVIMEIIRTLNKKRNSYNNLKSMKKVYRVTKQGTLLNIWNDSLRTHTNRVWISTFAMQCLRRFLVVVSQE